MFNLFKKRELKTINRVELDKEIENFKSIGVTDNEKDIIVSLTSFPERIYEIRYTLYSLLTQTVKPSKVVLWLASDEFPNGENDLPEDVLRLKSNGLTINWTRNICSYKKLIPALETYPNRIIVTADDDLFYEPDWLEKLINAYKAYPDCVITHRAHAIKLSRNKIAPYKKWKKGIKSGKPSYLNFLTSGGGTLYPVDCFYKDVLKDEIFLKLLPKADDIWIWAMIILNHKKIFVTKDHVKRLTYVNPQRERGLTNEKTLFSFNKKGGNDEQLKKLIEYYPEILDIISK